MCQNDKNQHFNAVHNSNGYLLRESQECMKTPRKKSAEFLNFKEGGS
jgi:hypothetical protein